MSFGKYNYILDKGKEAILEKIKVAYLISIQYQTSKILFLCLHSTCYYNVTFCQCLTVSPVPINHDK